MPLHLYRSSAGSGKTHTLVRAYLQLALKNPDRFSEILAVTFTNEATREMKHRILTHTHKLSQGTPHPMAQEIMQNQKWDETALQHKAKQLLSNILHNYDRFAISTLDSFFQSVLRGFAREMGLQSGFQIECDTEVILEAMTHEVMHMASQDAQLQRWLVDFAEHKVLTGQPGSFEREWKKLGRELFTEAFQSRATQLTTFVDHPEVHSRCLQEIKQTIDNFEHTLARWGQETTEILQEAQLEVTDFAYGKQGAAGYLISLGQNKAQPPTQRAVKAARDIQNWYKKGSPHQQHITKIVQQHLQPLLNTVIDHYQTHYKTYQTACAIQELIYTFGITTHMLAALQTYKRQNNLMLLSDASYLLRQIIGQNETPFVYEKMGNFYKHFLIDEFQDVSRFQWENIKPLIDNGLAEGHMSLLVGDAKQAIYRWRGSDWQLLHTQLTNDQPAVHTTTLDQNWRSSPHIVDFNNTLFAELSQWLVTYLQEEITHLPEDVDKLRLQAQIAALQTVYQDSYQQVPKGTEKADGGYVCMTFLPDSTDPTDTPNTWREQVKMRLPPLITSLQDDGFAPEDIALLVRNNAEARELAHFLLSYQQSAQAPPGYVYEAMAAESLYLGHSPWINILIQALRYITDTNTKPIAAAELVYLYNRYVRQADCTAFEASTAPQLPADFLQNRIALQQLPLYERVVALVELLGLDTAAAAPFVQAFQTIVGDYRRTHPTSSTHHFLAWWQTRGYKRTVPRGAAKGIIPIMTIHQAKGLQFKAVILPFCAWQIDHGPRNAPIIWGTPTSTGSTSASFPIRYSPRLKDTVYAYDYFEERLQVHIDNLNLLYVAFTRPEKRLYAFAKLPDRKTYKTTADILYRTFSQQPTPAPTGPHTRLRWASYWDFATHSLAIGQPTPLSSPVVQVGQPLYHPQKDGTGQTAQHVYSSIQERLNRDVTTKQHRQAAHVLATLARDSQLEETLAALRTNQQLSPGDIDAIRHKIEYLWEQSRIKAWYQVGWDLARPATVLMPDGHVYHPDRVMTQEQKAVVIDFVADTLPGRVEHKVKELRAASELLKQQGYAYVCAHWVDVAQGHLHNLVG
ncbi:MAG: UvrD-helicase domain-containing protein [Bacteroidota bacterium]